MAEHSEQIGVLDCPARQFQKPREGQVLSNGMRWRYPYFAWNAASFIERNTMPSMNPMIAGMKVQQKIR
jgi:hypothetical protein